MHLLEQVIYEGISQAALRFGVGAVVKFYGGYDSRRRDMRDDEINVLLRDAVGVAASPVAFGARDNVREPDLARNQIMMPDDHRKDVEKRGLVPGQQEGARSEDGAS